MTVSEDVASATAKFGSTPPNTAMTVLEFGNNGPAVGLCESSDDSSSGAVRLPWSWPETTMSGTVPIDCEPTQNVTVEAGARPFTLAGDIVAVNVTLSLYC